MAKFMARCRVATVIVDIASCRSSGWHELDSSTATAKALHVKSTEAAIALTHLEPSFAGVYRCIVTPLILEDHIRLRILRCC
jgi:hypothetical protein